MADKADKADKEDTTKTARAGEAAHGAGASLAILPSGPDVDEWSFPSLGAVPVALSSLVGRERDEAALIHALSQHRLVTMTGPGGVGKTRLSLQMGALLRDAGMRTLFVDCSEATSPSSLLNLLAHALDVGMQSDMPVLRGLAVLFSSVPTLLILDNFEQVIGAEGVLTVLLGHAPGLRLLVTSRIALHVKGEQEYPLSPLSTPHPEDINLDVVLASPAVRLFIQRVQAYRVSFSVTPQNMGAVAALCAYLDGLPLSIELVSWYARVFEPGEMLAALKRGDLIPVNRDPDAPTRHHDLAETVGWGYRLLDAEEQRFFRHLSVFSGPFTLEAAGVIGCPERSTAQASELLARLTERHMVQCTEDGLLGSTFSVFNTLRAFARERLNAEDTLDRVQARHTCYYTSFAIREGWRMMGPGQALALLALRRALPQLRAAFAEAVRLEDGEKCAEIAIMTRLFWMRTGDFAEGRDWLRIALDRAHASDAPCRLRIYLASSLAIIDAFAGRGPDALASAHLADDLAQTTQSHNLRALALFACASADYVTCRTQEGLVSSADGVEVARLAGDAWILGNLLRVRAAIAHQAGNLALAMTCCIKARSLLRRLGDAQAEAWVVLTRAYVARAQGERGRAMGLFADVLALADRSRDRVATVAALTGLATVVYPSFSAERAARLCGVVDRAQRELAWSGGRGNQESYPAAVAALRSTLGEDAWAREWERGARMTLQEATAAALALPHETWDGEVDQEQAGA